MENMVAFYHFAQSETSVSASVALIHTRSEDSPDSDSDCASIASVNQALYCA